MAGHKVISARCLQPSIFSVQQMGVGVEKMNGWIHLWLGFWPDMWDRKARNKESECMSKHLCSGGSQELGWEGKEVQTGGMGRQDPWRRMLEGAMVGWVSPTGGRGLVGGISG